MKKLLIVLVLAVAFVGASVGPVGATYTQQFALGNDSTFQGQVMVAMIQSCANTMTEAVTVAGHKERASFCTRVLQSPTFWNPIYSILLASQANNPMTPLTVPSTVADSLVQTASDAQLTNIAGYFKQ